MHNQSIINSAETRPDQDREDLKSRGPNSWTCVLVSTLLFSASYHLCWVSFYGQLEFKTVTIATAIAAEKSANCWGAASWQQGGIARSYGDNWSLPSPARLWTTVFLSVYQLYFSRYLNCISLTLSIVFLSNLQGGIGRSYGDSWWARSQPRPDFALAEKSLEKTCGNVHPLQKEVIKMRCTMQDLS